MEKGEVSGGKSAEHVVYTMFPAPPPLDQTLLSKKRPPGTNGPIEELGPTEVKLIS